MAAVPAAGTDRVAGRGRGRLSRWGLLDVALLAVVTWAVGRWATVFTGFPKGYDAWGHLSKARMLADDFPDVNWNDAWYAGQPAFAGSYPPGYHVVVAVVAGTTRLDLPGAMVAVAAATMIAVVAGAYGTVVAVSGRRLPAVVAALLVIATPAVWDQEAELGLYPRFAGFGLAVLGVAAGALWLRRHRRWRAAATVAFLGGALATHPVTGVIGVGLTGLLVVTLHGGAPRARLTGLVGLCGTPFALAAFFYLPLLLTHRAQSAFTDTEQPLTAQSLLFPVHGKLAALPPVMLVGTGLLWATLLWLLRDPCRHRHFDGLPGADQHLVARLLVEHDTWERLRSAVRPQLLAAAGITVAGLIPLGYGLVGYVDEHFPYYVNGLQPLDLLVFPGWLLPVALGIAGPLAVDRLRGRLVRIAFPAVGTAAVAGCLAMTVPLIPSGVRDSSGAATEALMSLLPAAAHDSTAYRILPTSDGTSRWINAVTDTPQMRGYDDHGDLHLDWQYWLQHTLSGSTADDQTLPAQRRFLLDYYSVRWLLTDATAADTALSADSAFARTGDEHVYADVSAWSYADAQRMATAVTAPRVLCLCDDAHYDLLLRALALTDVGPGRLLPVHGPADGDVSSAAMRDYASVLLYGTQPADEDELARTLRTYAAAGGHVVLDAGDSGALAALAANPASPLPVRSTTTTTVTGRWTLSVPTPSAALAGADDDAWGPPEWGAGGGWQVRLGGSLTRDAQVLLATDGRPLVITRRDGAGSATFLGLNFAYHAASFTNTLESTDLAALLGARAAPATAAPGTTPDAGPAVTDQRVSPDEHVLTVPAGAEGVLLRMYDAPDWHATVNGQAVPVLPAGLDMLYVPLHGTGATVTFTYTLSTVERLGFVLSAAALLALLGWLVGAGRPARALVRWLRRRAGRGGAPDRTRRTEVEPAVTTVGVSTDRAGTPG